MEMENRVGRFELKRYFYDVGTSWTAILFWVGLILLFIRSYSALGGVLLISWVIAKLVILFKRSTETEMLYDQFIVSDMEFLKKRAIGSMGLVSEEYSLIPPIITNWYGSNSDVIVGQAIAAKKDFIDYLKAIPRAILSFFLELLGLNDIISKAVFFEGSDKKIRCSLRSIAFITFTEQQIVAYFCHYDIALGIILSEEIREVFYRDVDSVNYGQESWHINLSNGSLRRVTASKILLSIPSQKNIAATVPANWDIMANVANTEDVLGDQVTAMKNLIRSKKEEMS